MKPFEIFRTGRHTSSQGQALTFSAADLQGVVSSYDPALHHAPIVVGHPKQDAPAFGWVSGLSTKGDRIVATPDSLDAAFSDLVKEGKFKKVSAAFYQPTSPNNPTPGKYYLRHVGFLGAAAPAVKGLQAIEFADDDLVVEFDDTEFSEQRVSWALETAARLFRGMRDFLIETKDVETADRILPAWDVDQLTRSAAEMRVENPTVAYSDDEPKETAMQTEEQRLAHEAREQQLTEREARIAERDAELAAQQRATRDIADAAFVDGIIGEGRLPIGLKATATALFSDLGDEELTFADGDEEKKTTPRDAFRALLENLPKPVVTEELSAGDPGPDFSDPQAMAVAITAEVKTAADKGETISPADAAGRIKARQK